MNNIKKPWDEELKCFQMAQIIRKGNWKTLPVIYLNATT